MRSIALFVLSVLLFSACKERRVQGPVVASSSAPKAIREKEGASLAYSKGRAATLLESLYHEQVDKDTAIRRLEAALDWLHRNEADSTIAAAEFIRINDEYYEQALQLASAIGDSVLRARISGRVQASRRAFTIDHAGLDAGLATIRKNKTSLRELHAAFKVLVTLGVMERFQKSDFPPDAAMKRYALEQERLKRQLRDSVIKN